MLEGRAVCANRLLTDQDILWYEQRRTRQDHPAQRKPRAPENPRFAAHSKRSSRHRSCNSPWISSCSRARSCRSDATLAARSPGRPCVRSCSRGISPALARTGNNLVLDYIVEEKPQLECLVALLEGLDVFFVGVHCPLPELERRERARGDRRIRDARRDLETVHLWSGTPKATRMPSSRRGQLETNRACSNDWRLRLEGETEEPRSSRGSFLVAMGGLEPPTPRL
ncbi:MAG: hypothetical protein HC933_10015 [Pleurocapsa sp. SU_196_0]|nr:hypothetical protein [Pleurocapsa sp. SU_196_0]